MPMNVYRILSVQNLDKWILLDKVVLDEMKKMI